MQAPSPVPIGATPDQLARIRADVDRLVADLVRAFQEQVRRSLGVHLDGSVTSLAYVDHYLAQARGESREAILTLLAASAGAYFGEVVRGQIGGHWLGDGKDPRTLLLALEPSLIYFSPYDLALEAILGESLEAGDPRLPPGHLPDASFHFPGITPRGARSHQGTRRGKGRAAPTADPDAVEGVDADATDDVRQADVDWVFDNLAAFAPVSADHYYSLTCRLETLELIIELLASREAERGCEPQTYTFDDYLRALQDVVGTRTR
ncbi:MAG TPA: hypothetical protein PKW35_03530 [Nannocystaceae bacterium]|nr:hypothetical protein [Nannocystaceae bacterium]